VVTLSDLMVHVSLAGGGGDLHNMRLYRDRYGLAE